VKPKPTPDAGPSLGGGRLASLLAAKGLVSGDRAPEAAPAPAPAGGGEPRFAAMGKLVVRRERKGRGGKTVTVLEGLPPDDAAQVARELRKTLGCGVGVEDGVLILQGDQTERAATWLEGRGARRVVRGT